MPTTTRPKLRKIIRPASTSSDKPITYCDPLLRDIDYFASRLGRSVRELLAATDTGMRTHFARARVAEDCDAANGRQPNIYTLSLGRFNVHFTDEPDALVIRGYSFRTHDRRAEAMDGGLLHHCNSWHAPVKNGTT